MIVLDASVLIAHLSERDVHHERAVRLLEESAGEALGVNTVNLAEALVEPAQKGKLREARAAIERLGVIELPFGADAHVRLAELRAKSGHKLPDCCVLLAAKEIGGVVASFDSALTEAAKSLKLITVS
ncbi:MAG TPA: type II toxin-antitoxin system VapC family toxin [Solirubrobacterales bacterium]|nr:type II toxin-antitoxin system VapC family toxin [Solirubrobacterales bacterium]